MLLLISDKTSHRKFQMGWKSSIILDDLEGQYYRSASSLATFGLSCFTNCLTGCAGVERVRWGTVAGTSGETAAGLRVLRAPWPCHRRRAPSARRSSARRRAADEWRRPSARWRSGTRCDTRRRCASRQRSCQLRTTETRTHSHTARHHIIVM